MAQSEQSHSLSLLEALSSVPDPRSKKGRRHPLPGVLALLCTAMLCNQRSVYAALQWARDHGQEMVAALGLAKHGVPTDGMMSNLLQRLDVQAFEAALSQWAAACEARLPRPKDMPLEAVPIDGKTLRGTQGHHVPGVHLLAAFSARLKLVLKQVSAGANKEDGGEITAAPELIKGLVLQGKVITGDAIHAQRGLCQAVVDGGGHYLVTVKDNQPALHLELVDLFRSPCAPFLPAARATSTAAGWRRGRSGSAASWPDGGTGRG